ncbi:MAG: anthranilate phosphoribosyltransferase [Acidimicrobiales bacterium]
MTGVEAHGGWPVLLGTITARHDLSREAAAAAMADILAGQATPAQIAGLIVGLRLKGESVEEMTGMVTAMRAAAEPLAVPAGTIDIVGTGGSDHRRRHALNVSTMASIVAAAAGAVVCKHGNRRASSTSGSFDFLEAIGVEGELSPADLERCIADVGVGFAFARTYHPAMRFAGPVRAELGIPTVFNVLGPLANPGRVDRQVVGAASAELAASMAEVLLNLGSRHAWVVAGHGGLDELSTTGPAVVYEVTVGGVRRFGVDPADLGLAPVASLDELTGGSPEDNAAIFAAILDGSERGARYEIVVLNAGAGLVVAGIAATLSEGVRAAADAVADGRAADTLRRLVATTNPVPS